MIAPQTVAVSPKERRFSVEEYHQMREAGVFGENERVELIRGVIYTMTAKGPRHNRGLTRLTRLFYSCLTETIIISVQDPIDLGVSVSEPEPDLALLKPRTDDYVDALPRAEDIVLIVEVADSSVKHDHEQKSELYAEVGITDYWIMNLVMQCIEVLRDPGSGPDGTALYRSHRIYFPGETVTPLHFPDCQVDVSAVLPGLQRSVK